MAAMTKGKHMWAPHGLLQLHLKRHTGRVRVESDLYSLSQGGGIETDAAPQEVITAQLLAAHNVGRLGGLGATSTNWPCKVGESGPPPPGPISLQLHKDFSDI